jgi:hypothetical protein
VTGGLTAANKGPEKNPKRLMTTAPLVIFGTLLNRSLVRFCINQFFFIRRRKAEIETYSQKTS